MDQNLQHTYDISAESAPAVRHKVLRNTYWLLALSMVPTVLGAWIGVMTKFTFFSHSFIGLIAFLAIAVGGIYAIEKNKNSGIGVAILLGFTFFMGLALTGLLMRTLGFANGATLIMTAFGGTAAVFGVMASIATVSKRDFSGLGKWLFAGLIVIIVASIANIFLQLPMLYVVISVIAIAIFSAYILYDVQQIINGGETNYISATLSLYLDVYNIFTNLLSLLGIFGGDRD
jgi:modulator of FtsH protease